MCATGKYSEYEASNDKSACRAVILQVFREHWSIRRIFTCNALQDTHNQNLVSFCLPCVPGKYQDEANAKSTKPCPVNHLPTRPNDSMSHVGSGRSLKLQSLHRAPSAFPANLDPLEITTNLRARNVPLDTIVLTDLIDRAALGVYRVRLRTVKDGMLAKSVMWVSTASAWKVFALPLWAVSGQERGNKLLELQTGKGDQQKCRHTVCVKPDWKTARLRLASQYLDDTVKTNQTTNAATARSALLRRQHHVVRRKG